MKPIVNIIHILKLIHSGAYSEPGMRQKRIPNKENTSDFY